MPEQKNAQPELEEIEELVTTDKKRGKFAAKKNHYLKRRMAAMER